jgi:GntR family transcriptional regulator/MocR family aminotransferase
LAEQLGISRTVVLLAYDQLLAEGFVDGRGGSGTYAAQGLGKSLAREQKKSVNFRLSRFGSAAVNATAAADTLRHSSILLRYDFAYGNSDIETFPFEMWRRILMKHAREAPVRQFEYGPAVGVMALREAICGHPNPS